MCHQRVTEHSCSHRSITAVQCALASSGNLIPHFTEPASYRLSRRKCESCEKDASLKQKARREIRANLNHPDGLALNPYLRARVGDTSVHGVRQRQQINASLENTNGPRAVNVRRSRAEAQDSSFEHQKCRVSPTPPDCPSTPHSGEGASSSALPTGSRRQQINTTIGSIDSILAANPPQPNPSTGQGHEQRRFPQGRLPVMNRLIRHPSCLIPGLSGTALLTPALPSALRTLRSLSYHARNQRSSSTRRGTFSAMQTSALYHSKNWQHSQRSQPLQDPFSSQHSQPSQSSSHHSKRPEKTQVESQHEYSLHLQPARSRPSHHPQHPENTHAGSQRPPLLSNHGLFLPQIQLQHHFPRLCLEGKVTLGVFQTALQNY